MQMGISKSEIEEAKKRKGLCDFCLTKPATKTHKTRDGMKVHLCSDCYEQEKRKKA
jgi:NMD protein affecting ribosome stability and mRNA decay